LKKRGEGGFSKELQKNEKIWLLSWRLVLRAKGRDWAMKWADAAKKEKGNLQKKRNRVTIARRLVIWGAPALSMQREWLTTSRKRTD